MGISLAGVRRTMGSTELSNMQDMPAQAQPSPDVEAAVVTRPQQSRTISNMQLNSISQMGLYYGPYFVLAGNEDLVPFFQLVESADLNDDVTLLSNILGNIWQDEEHSTLAEISPVQTCHSKINLPAETIKLKQVERGFVLEAVIHASVSSELKIDMFELNSYGLPFITMVEASYDVNIAMPEDKGFDLGAAMSSSNSSTHAELPGSSPSEARLIPSPTFPPAKSIAEMPVVLTLKTLSQPEQKMIVYGQIVSSDHETTGFAFKVTSKQFHIGGDKYALDDIYGYVDDTKASQQSLAASAVQQLENSPDCVICMSEAKNTIALPCRHMCLCRGCADVMRQQPNSKCPICRQTFHALLQIVSADATPQTAL